MPEQTKHKVRKAMYLNEENSNFVDQLTQLSKTITKTKGQEHYDSQLKNLIFEAFIKGLRNCEISRITNISPTTIRRWRHELSSDKNQNIMSKKSVSFNIANSRTLRKKKCKIDYGAKNDIDNIVRILPVKGEATEALGPRPFFTLNFGRLKLELNFKWGDNQ